ncbi:hypothetical protein EV702DRAFT_1047449 [Suillus placidus]|uniref:Uncharacterized protein n=1 Tax=Suillus placidus TaxID=48579 RepID=A0A9P7D145_9AGAM|nr:hypothetical protein EV702DRAFT_1047449 [Suillus placidus]
MNKSHPIPKPPSRDENLVQVKSLPLNLILSNDVSKLSWITENKSSLRSKQSWEYNEFLQKSHLREIPHSTPGLRIILKSLTQSGRKKHLRKDSEIQDRHVWKDAVNQQHAEKIFLGQDPEGEGHVAKRLRMFPNPEMNQTRAQTSNERKDDVSQRMNSGFCYEEWSDDPKFYRTKITTTTGCPKLSTSQWTLFLEGKAVDLDKVFTGQYSTAIDTKQTQSLGKGFKLSLSQPTVSHKVKSAGDWGIATDLWIRVFTFIMPWREEEIQEYQDYIADIFGNHHYSVHE